MKLSFVLLFLPLLCVACTTPGTASHEACEAIDWRQVGLREGAEGQHRDHYRALERSCEETAGSDTAIDHDMYFAGWEEGHIDYCTAVNGYKAGAGGKVTADICDSESYPAFHEQFLLGQKARTEKRGVASDAASATAAEASASTTDKR